MAAQQAADVIVLGDSDSDSDHRLSYRVSENAAAISVGKRVKFSRERKPAPVFELHAFEVNPRMSRKRGAMAEIQSSFSNSNKKKKCNAASPKPVLRKLGGPKKQPAPAPVVSEDDDFTQEPPLSIVESDEEEDRISERSEALTQRRADKMSVDAYFQQAFPAAQAKKRWPDRYIKDASPECAEHYEQAVVDGVQYKLGDCVKVNGDGSEYLGRVLEFFRSTNDENWFRVQWFFRLNETTVGKLDVNMDPKRIFCSELEDDNFLECINGKITVACVSASDNFLKQPRSNPACDYYYDMGFSYDFSTFYELPSEKKNCKSKKSAGCIDTSINSNTQTELTLLDLYSGCGGMSAGLCMGAALGGVKLATKWALDVNECACESMKQNHPETEVWNEDANNFLHLLREWQRLCTKFEENVLVNSRAEKSEREDGEDGEEEYEVEKIVGIRLSEVWKSSSSKSPAKSPERQLEFKVRWKGYASDYDTWEPTEHLEECQERIQEFVVEGRRRRLLPLPGEVDMICGGPPCQGASGFNRYRNTETPLECPRNRQVLVYMNIVEFLKPRFVLMENVVDILKFCGGILGRYAMHRLVDMHYQARLGLVIAGSYGLPQFRMRVFLWGAAPSEPLPPFPLPTHNVIYRGAVPQNYWRNVVKHVNESPDLEDALLLKDAISDLPPVDSSEKRNDMLYKQEPKTEFQRYIRSAKNLFYDRTLKYESYKVLHDHRPLHLNEDDYQRVLRVPKVKGANFRNFGGIRIRTDNAVELDPSVPREYLPSGKPLLPDYVFTFVKGRSLKPYARLWWDETVATVVTQADPRNKQTLHPSQDRVLTVRENARLQGFPDWYRFFGSVKERYIQVGNAVAIPVARAIGYSLASTRIHSCDEPLFQLPKGFPCF